MSARRDVVSCALLAALLAAAPASAQDRYRRPYAETYRLNYGYDHDGGGGCCTDYDCGGACYDGHEGSDLGAPFGTTVLAAEDGVVSFVSNGCANYGYVGNSCGSYCGNYVRIDHPGGTRSIYCHMMIDSIPVHTGDAVRCGQMIGVSASSGSSSGPHLHFGYRPTTTAAYHDPFHGGCNGDASYWVMQNAYRDAPGDACQCRPSTEVCNGADDDCDGAVDEDDVCDATFLDHDTSGAPPSTTDVDGDGHEDLCARAGDGVHCWLARAAGTWAEAAYVVPLSDDGGWADASNYATLRMGDVNGDHRADLCARGDDGVYCALSEGATLGAPTQWSAEPSDANGWSVSGAYTTLRLADVDGDGREDLCGRDASGFGCWLSDGTRFGRRVPGPDWSDASGWGVAKYYGTIRMADVDGDGRADACARGAAGVVCWLSNGSGFPTRVDGPAWGDDRGWGDRRYWSTLRLGDVNGDGRADLCAIDRVDARCLLSSGAAFDRAVVFFAFDGATAWDDPTHYATLRVGDVDGDGASDVCLRDANAVKCAALHEGSVTVLDGPGWSDAGGWNAPQYAGTIRLVDVDGDGREDVCGRGAAGWSCARASGAGFDATTGLDALRDDQGWTGTQYYSTILAGGHACHATGSETCNGVDDDCDGRVDEDGVCGATDGRADAAGTGRPPAPMAGGGCCSAAGLGGLHGGVAVAALCVVAALARRRRKERGGCGCER